jgi:signal peptidase I
MKQINTKFTKFNTLKLYIMAAVQIAAVIFFVTIFLKLFVVDFFRIRGSSMHPTFEDGRQVVVSRLAYFAGLPDYIYPIGAHPDRWRIEISEPARGDIVALYFPVNNKLSKPSVKRIIAAPGDSIFFSDDWICLSRRSAPEGESPQAALLTPGPGTTIDLDLSNIDYYKYAIESEGNEVRIVNGSIYINGFAGDTYRFARQYYFVAGDNTRISYDSRHWGFMPHGAIQGKVIFRLWGN